MSHRVPPLSYHPLEKLPVGRPVDRYQYVAEQCRGRRVLDLGAYDETEVDKDQHSSWRWLHAEIAAVAEEVLGVDASPRIPAEGLSTSVGTRIERGSVEDLADLVRRFGPELVVAGELIEHTTDTLSWLARLAEVAPGVDLLATTPNATSLVNLGLAPFGRENNHHDHLQIYSYKTLTTLAARIPLGEPTLTPYFYDPHIFLGRVTGLRSSLVAATDRLILKPIQWAFPLTAFGWILEGSLGGSE